MWYFKKTVNFTGCGISTSKQLKFGKGEVKLWDICYIEVLNQLLLYKPCLYKELFPCILEICFNKTPLYICLFKPCSNLFHKSGLRELHYKMCNKIFLFVNASSIQQLTLTIIWLWQIKKRRFPYLTQNNGTSSN